MGDFLFAVALSPLGLFLLVFLEASPESFKAVESLEVKTIINFAFILYAASIVADAIAFDTMCLVDDIYATRAE